MEPPSPATPAGAHDFERAAMEAELARQRHESAELARVARLISETLDLTTVGQRIAESVLGLLEVHSSAIRLFLPDGTLGPIALGGRAKEYDRAIITEQAPVAIAEAVLWRLRDLLGVPRAIVNLFDYAAGEVEWLAAVGRHRMHLGPGIRYSLRFAGDLDALRRGSPRWSTSARSLRAPKPAPCSSRASTCTWWCR